MFCEKCGKKLEDDSKFCEHCGAPVVSDQATPAPAAPVATAAPAAVQQKAKSFLSNKKNVTILAAVAAVLVLVIVAVSVINALPTKMVLDDYISIEYSGLSTQGYAYLNFNEELFLADLGTEKELFGTALSSYYAQIWATGISLELDKTVELANGDEINIVFENNEEALKELGLKLVLNDPVIVVEGLQEPIYLDLFEGLEFTYSNCAPYAYAEISATSDNSFIKDNVYYYLEGAYDLSGGSVFTVYANYSEYTANENGYIIKENSKEITVAAEDLPQPVELNPFDYVTVTFDGIEGEGYAECEIDYDACDFLGNLRFEFNKDYDLSEGETITLSYTNPYDSDPLYYGYTLTNTTAQQYTVPKLDSHITAFSQLPESERTKILDKVDELAHYYLTKESNPNGTLQIKLTGTDYNNGNELSHAAGTGNLKLHSVVAGKISGWWSSTPYLVFVYTFDITGHPNVTDNEGNVTGACVYLYIENPVMNGDGTLDNSIDEDILCNSRCYLSYEELEKAFLEDLEDQDVYDAG